MFVKLTTSLRMETACLAVMALTASNLPALAEMDAVIGLPTTISIAGTAPVLAALELGYFKDEGINLTLQEFQGGAALLPQVSTKNVIYGEGAVDALVGAVKPGGAALPVKSFYTHSPNYIWKWVVPADSPINTLADLKGKTIGVGALGNSHMPVSRHLMKEAGLTEGTDFNFMAISVGAPAFHALQQGQVDAYNTWGTNIASFEAVSGEKLKQLPLPEDIATLAGSGYYAHVDTIRDNPELLVGFGRAVAKATVVCTHAPEWCVTQIWKSYPHLVPRNGSYEDNLKAAVYVINAQAEAYNTANGQVPAKFGYLSEDYVPKLLNILGVKEMLEAQKIEPSAFYTNELIDQINAFDVEALKAYAKEMKPVAENG